MDGVLLQSQQITIPEQQNVTHRSSYSKEDARLRKIDNINNSKRLLHCEICKVAFRRQDHLKRHLECVHVNMKYCKCPVCNIYLESQELVSKHLEQSHRSTEDRYRCRDCPEEFTSYSSLEMHEISHVVSYQRHMCPHCTAAFKRRDHMLRHVKSQHLNQFVTCPICSQNYKRRDHLVRHVREKHRMGYINGQVFKANDLL